MDSQGLLPWVFKDKVMVVGAQVHILQQLKMSVVCTCQGSRANTLQKLMTR